MQRVQLLMSNLERFVHPKIVEFSYATACSGTDVVSAAMGATLRYWSTKFGVVVHCRHLFSCESVAFKRDFISRHHRPERIFNDVHKLSDDFAWGELSGKEQTVPCPDSFWAGFMCDQYSPLNIRASEAQGSYRRNQGSSGTTGRSVAKFVMKRRPKWSTLENVKAANRAGVEGAESDVEALVRDLNSVGIYVRLDHLNALEFMCPQSRPRIYLQAVLASSLPIDQFNSEFSTPPVGLEFGAFLREIRQPRTFLLEDFLAPPSFSEFGVWYHDAFPRCQASTDQASSSKKSDHLYQVDHLDTFTACEMPWPPSYSDDPELEAAMGSIPERQKQCIWFHERKPNSSRCATNREKVYDTNMNLSWQVEPPEGAQIGCLTSTTRGWILNLRRPLLGAEALYLQGFHYKHLRNSDKHFSQANLMDLAGNAFCGFACAAILIAGFGSIDFDSLEPFIQRLQPDTDVSGSEVEESEEEQKEEAASEGNPASELDYASD